MSRLQSPPGGMGFFSGKVIRFELLHTHTYSRKKDVSINLAVTCRIHSFTVSYYNSENN